MAPQEISVQWNDHPQALAQVFERLLVCGTLVDCTIAAEGQYLKAHKVILSASSPYFELLFSQENEKNPIVVLKDIKFQELKTLIDFVYRGQVTIPEDQLSDFMGVADSLQIRGMEGVQNINTPERKNKQSSPVRWRQNHTSPVACKKSRRSSGNNEENTDTLIPITNVNNESNSCDSFSNIQEAKPNFPATELALSSKSVTPCTSLLGSSAASDERNVEAEQFSDVQCNLSSVEQFQMEGHSIKSEPESLTDLFQPESECLVETKDEVCVEESSILGNEATEGVDSSRQENTNHYSAFVPALPIPHGMADGSLLMPQVDELPSIQGSPYNTHGDHEKSVKCHDLQGKSGCSTAQPQCAKCCSAGTVHNSPDSAYQTETEQRAAIVTTTTTTAASTVTSTATTTAASAATTTATTAGTMAASTGTSTAVDLKSAGATSSAVKTLSSVKYKCPDCGKVLFNQLRWLRHLRMHSVMCYKCRICNQAFASSGTLINHLDNHVGKQPYFCTNCDRGFYTSRQFKAHENAICTPIRFLW